MSRSSAEPVASPGRRSALRHAIATVAIILAAGALYLIGGDAVALWDCDEAWYAQASRQILESGDWLVPRFLDQVRSAKPILIYWCQAGSMRVFGVSVMSARLPSAIAVVVVLGVLAVFVGRTLGMRRAMFTVLVFATSLLVISVAKMCLTDGVLLVWITGAQVCLLCIYRWPRNRVAPLLLWVFIGLAGLTKGPMILAVLVSTMAALAGFDVGKRWRIAAAWKNAARWWLATRPLTGILVLAAVVLPWILAAHHRDPQFVRDLVLEPFRHIGGNQSGGHPSFPRYHLIAIWLTFFPWSLFLPAAIVYGWRHRRSVAVRFAMASVLGIWVFVEIMVTKLPHYFLPAYAPLAFLTGCAIVRRIRHANRPIRHWRLTAGAGIWLLATVALGLVVWAPLQYGLEIPRPAAMAFTAAVIAYGLLVFALMATRRLAAGVTAMGIGLMLVVSVLVGAYLPRASFLHGPQLAGTLLAQVAPDDGDCAAVGIRLFNPADYVEDGLPAPSLAFYQGGTVRERGDDYLATERPEDWPKWLVVTDRVYARLPEERRKLLRPIATCRTFNYNIPVGVVDVLILRKVEKRR